MRPQIREPHPRPACQWRRLRLRWPAWQRGRGAEGTTARPLRQRESDVSAAAREVASICAHHASTCAWTAGHQHAAAADSRCPSICCISMDAEGVQPPLPHAARILARTPAPPPISARASEQRLLMCWRRRSKPERACESHFLHSHRRAGQDNKQCYSSSPCTTPPICCHPARLPSCSTRPVQLSLLLEPHVASLTRRPSANHTPASGPLSITTGFRASHFIVAAPGHPHTRPAFLTLLIPVRWPPPTPPRSSLRCVLSNVAALLAPSGWAQP
jgi:hypothetical protein